MPKLTRTNTTNLILKIMPIIVEPRKIHESIVFRRKLLVDARAVLAKLIQSMPQIASRLRGNRNCGAVIGIVWTQYKK